jgi:hypothetical protein
MEKIEYGNDLIKDSKVLHLSTQTTGSILLNGSYKSKASYDVRGYLNFENDDSIEYITVQMPYAVMCNSNYIVNEYNNTLIVTKNYGLVELFLYYKNYNFDHFHYYLNIEEQEKISTKMKSIYSFNDYKYGIKLNKTYDFMIFDLLLTRIYDIEDNIVNSKLLKIITDKEETYTWHGYYKEGTECLFTIIKTNGCNRMQYTFFQENEAEEYLVDPYL